MYLDNDCMAAAILFSSNVAKVSQQFFGLQRLRAERDLLDIAERTS